MILEILSDGTERTIEIPIGIQTKLFGYQGTNSCFIGKIRLIARSKVSPRFDLAYIDLTHGKWIVGFLQDLKPYPPIE